MGCIHFTERKRHGLFGNYTEEYHCASSKSPKNWSVLYTNRKVSGREVNHPERVKKYCTSLRTCKKCEFY